MTSPARPSSSRSKACSEKMQQVDGEPPQMARVPRRRNSRPTAVANDRAGDLLGLIPGALELGDGSRHRDDRLEIARHGLAPRDEPQLLLIEHRRIGIDG